MSPPPRRQSREFDSRQLNARECSSLCTLFQLLGPPWRKSTARSYSSCQSHLLGKMSWGKRKVTDRTSFATPAESDQTTDFFVFLLPPSHSLDRSLRDSLDVVRYEVEATGKSHIELASKIRDQLELALAEFNNAQKEKRKLVKGSRSHSRECHRAKTAAELMSYVNSC